MIEIKRIQQQPDLAQAIYAVIAAVYLVSPWTLEQIKQICPKTRLGMHWLMMGQK